eukprot:m.10553 g.10553  ORF g.10553 m.10553 type:complete len:96 (-) comp3689_c0_seq1:406-693(-)
MSSEKEVFEKIMNGEMPDMMDEKDAVGNAIMDGEMPIETFDESDIGQKIMDGELTAYDVEENVNRDMAADIIKNTKSDATDEQKEMARKIMNGEI